MTLSEWYISLVCVLYANNLATVPVKLQSTANKSATSKKHNRLILWDRINIFSTKAYLSLYLHSKIQKGDEQDTKTLKMYVKRIGYSNHQKVRKQV